MARVARVCFDHVRWHGRSYAHIYHAHFKDVMDDQEVKHLNTWCVRVCVCACACACVRVRVRVRVRVCVHVQSSEVVAFGVHLPLPPPPPPGQTGWVSVPRAQFHALHHLFF